MLLWYTTFPMNESSEHTLYSMKTEFSVSWSYVHSDDSNLLSKHSRSAANIFMFDPRSNVLCNSLYWIIIQSQWLKVHSSNMHSNANRNSPSAFRTLVNITPFTLEIYEGPFVVNCESISALILSFEIN